MTLVLDKIADDAGEDSRLDLSVQDGDQNAKRAASQRQRLVRSCGRRIGRGWLPLLPRDKLVA